MVSEKSLIIFALDCLYLKKKIEKGVPCIGLKKKILCSSTAIAAYLNFLVLKGPLPDASWPLECCPIEI